MNKLQEKIFEFVLKRQPARSVVMPDWKKTRNIAVLYSNNNISNIMSQLSSSGKNVTLICPPDKKGICWLSERPKKQIREQLKTKQYDLLIDLTQESSLTMQYMAMYINAKFKTGRHTREGIYDLSIDTKAQETPDFLYEQIVHYIKMFTKK